MKRKSDIIQKKQEIEKQMLVNIKNLFPELKIQQTAMLNEGSFLAQAYNQKYGVIILKLPHLTDREISKYKKQLILLKHQNVLQVKTMAQSQQTKELIIITQTIDKCLKDQHYEKQDQLMKMLKMMHLIVEGCIYLQNNLPHLLKTIQYRSIFLCDNIPKILTICYIKRDQEDKMLKTQRIKQTINFRQVMHNLGIVFLSIIHKEQIDSQLQPLKIQIQINRIKSHQLMIMVNEMIFNQNQIQIPTFDDILIYLTRIKYLNMKFQGIKMNIKQIYSHYQESSKYLEFDQQLNFFNSYQAIIQIQAKQQNELALFLQAKMLSIRLKMQDISYKSYKQNEKIKNLYLSAYKKGEKYSAFQLYLLQQQVHQNQQEDENNIVYLKEAIKRQDSTAYVDIQRLRYNGSYDIKKEPLKAIQNLQKITEKNAYLYYTLAIVYLENDQYQKAEKYIARCFAYNQNQVLLQLAQYWLRQKQQDRNIEYRKKHIKYLCQNQKKFADELGQDQLEIGQSYRFSDNIKQAKIWYTKCFSKLNRCSLSALIAISFIDDENRLMYLNKAIQLSNDTQNNLRLAFQEIGLYYLNQHGENERQNIEACLKYFQLSQKLGEMRSMINKGKLLQQQTNLYRNLQLSVQILYEAYKLSEQSQEQQQIFQEVIEEEDYQ